MGQSATSRGKRNKAINRIEVHPAQLGLFDELLPLERKAVAPAKRVDARSQAAKPLAAAKPIRQLAPKPRIVAVEDLPSYSAGHVAAVEKAISEIKTDRVFLGYKDLKDFFGVSKATANRRMKDGFVPGVQIMHGNVVRDGGVRRLDRDQVKWLLLSIRCAADFDKD